MIVAREDLTKIISGAAGLFSVLAILLLLYIVVCNVFFNHDGYTEKVFGKKEASKPGKALPVILPIAMGVVMLIVNIIIAYTQRGGLYTDINSGIFSVFSKDASVFSVWNLFLCIISVGLYTAGSVFYGKIGGKKYSILFCLNIALSLIIMPHIYSLIAFMWALGYWAFKCKKYWLLTLATVVGVVVHFPMHSFNMGELFMLAYLALIPVMAKTDKEQFKFLTVVLALASGIFAVFAQLIIR